MKKEYKIIRKTFSAKLDKLMSSVISSDNDKIKIRGVRQYLNSTREGLKAGDIIEKIIFYKQNNKDIVLVEISNNNDFYYISYDATILMEKIKCHFNKEMTNVKDKIIYFNELCNTLLQKLQRKGLELYISYDPDFSDNPYIQIDDEIHNIITINNNFSSVIKQITNNQTHHAHFSFKEYTSQLDNYIEQLFLIAKRYDIDLSLVESEEDKIID